MTAVYTWDVFSTLDGYGTYAEGADWGGYWGKQGPELLEHRAAAGLVDRLQVTIFPAISGRTGTRPVLGGAGDFDLELLESRTLDGRTQELVYRPTPR